MTRDYDATFLRHLFFKWWKLKALLGGCSSQFHHSIIFLKKISRKNISFLYIDLKKKVELWRRSGTRAVEPKNAATISKKGGVNGGVPSVRSTVINTGPLCVFACGSTSSPNEDKNPRLLGHVI